MHITIPSQINYSLALQIRHIIRHAGLNSPSCELGILVVLRAALSPPDRLNQVFLAPGRPRTRKLSRRWDRCDIKVDCASVGVGYIRCGSRGDVVDVVAEYAEGE